MYHNTTHVEGTELRTRTARANVQQEAVLEYFRTQRIASASQAVTRVRNKFRDDMNKQTWDSMSPAARRVAIAEDAIARTEAGQYRLEIRTYLEPCDDPHWNFTSANLGHSLREGRPCYVCAIGGLFASRVSLDPHTSNLMKDHLRASIQAAMDGEFSARALDVIESLLEGFSRIATTTEVSAPGGPASWYLVGEHEGEVSWWAWGCRHLYEAQRAEMADTGVLEVAKALRHLTRKERMLWIMRNIADNGGDLVVGKLAYS